MAEMKSFQWLLPFLMAALIIAAALGFVRYFNAYEAPGDHWAPASPVTHENARFTTDMGAAGDYRVTVEKLASKFPLLFVEYQPPGLMVDTTIHSDDGVIRLDQRFADEGSYRVTVQHTIHPNHREVIDFTVQTPLYKYANDLVLVGCLLLAGWVSGRRLRQLAAVAMVLLACMGAMPKAASAHGNGGSHPSALAVGAQDGTLTLSWLRQPPDGAANNAPLDWSVRLRRSDGAPIGRAPFRLEIIHSETHFPVLTLSGVTTSGTIPLRYSPPDGTDYQLLLQAVVDGKVHHVALDAAATPIRPTATRQWQSFGLMLIPLCIGMAWGWRRSSGG